MKIVMSCIRLVSLRTADAFLVVASLPPKNSERYFSEGEKRRLEMSLLFAG